MALRDFLQAQGAVVQMSRTTTPQTIGLAARMTMANNFNATAVISIHSDAFNGIVNRPLGLYHTTNRHAQAQPLARGIVWYLADNPVTRWSENPVSRTNTRAQNLTMNSNSVRPAVLIESSFHDYRPEAHRYLSQMYANMKAYNYFRGILRWRGINTNQLPTGFIVGEVREHGRLITASSPANGSRYLTPANAARLTDRYWAVNGARVDLMQNDNVIRTVTVDNNWNGIFSFDNVPPGTYQIRISANGYQTQTITSIVTRGNITGHRVNLRPGEGGTPPSILRLVMGTGEAGANPNVPPYGTHVTTADVGTTLYLGIDQANNPNSPSWYSRINSTLTSSNTNVASIATDGVITTRAPGTTTITAVRNSDGATGSIQLTVTGEIDTGGLTADGRLRLRITEFRTGGDANDPEIDRLPYNTTTAGSIFIWDTATNAVVSRRGQPGGTTIYTTHPGGSVSEWGTISTAGLPNGTMMTIRVENAGRSALITLPVGTDVPVPTYEVAFSSTGNGMLAATVNDSQITSGTQVRQGENVVFTATPSIGSRIRSWTVNDEANGETGNTLTLTNLAANTRVVVEFGSEIATGVGNIFHSMQIFPNPFTNTLNITGAENSLLQVVNVLGTIVYTRQIISADENVNLSDLPIGIYFFRVEKDGQTKTMKIVKQ